MRIENLGLPGSGKSTLSACCRKKLHSSGYISVDPNALDKIDAVNPPANSRLWRDGKWRQNHHMARFLNVHVKLHVLFNSLYGNNMRNLSLALGIGADLSRYQTNSERLHSFWVDEGFFHLGVHALLEASGWEFPDCLEHVDAFLETVPLPDVVLHLDASVEIATKGIFARFSGRSKEQAARRFSKTFGGTKGMETREQLIEVIVQRLKSEGTRVITVAAHTDLEDMSCAVLDKLGVEIARNGVSCG